MTREHRALTFLLAIVVFLQTSCAVPVRPEHLAQRDKSSLGRVAVVVARFEPDYQFKALVVGKDEGAARGGAAGMASCGEFLKGSGSGLAAGMGVVVFLACLPVGAIVGSIHGASHAASAKQVEEARAAAQRRIAELKLQNQVADAAMRYGIEVGLNIVQPWQAVGPGNPADLPIYSELQGMADTVIEISVLHANAFESGDRGLRAFKTEKREQLMVSLGMQARIRAINLRDGKVIDSFTVKYSDYLPRTIDEWIVADGQAIKAAFDHGSAWIAEQAIDEIMLIYYPETVVEPPESLESERASSDSDAAAQLQKFMASKKRASERVPPYALRAIEPPIRSKIYWGDERRMNYGHLERYLLNGFQPVFRWEAWPRGFGISPGDEPMQAHQVRYDLRIFDEAGIVYERYGIVDTEHRLEQPLEACHTYRWTVRARFILNNAPRTTEWTGAYNTGAGQVAPWWWRRGEGVPALAMVPDNVVPFYPLVESPSIDGKTCPGR